MSDINFKTKVTSHRPKNPPYGRLGKLESAVESDRGRIINSAAVRRLQQKTQVFPLERNAAVRSRLTHSLEVQQVGRFIVQKIFAKLGNQDLLNIYNLADLERPVESIVEMACLMHDIGNPPFGHFGEKAINDWFASHRAELLPDTLALISPVLFTKIRIDLLSFEGNAQAIRIVHTLLQANLTYTQTAAILKYTRPAFMHKDDVPESQKYLMKKPGYYLSEESYIEKLRETLGMKLGARHPLTYIMEAADDISYCLADLEDSVEKGILTVRHLCDLLLSAYGELGGQTDKDDLLLFKDKISFNTLIKDALKKFDNEDIDKVNQFFVKFRVSVNHVLVDHAAKRFVDNIESIYEGNFNHALLEDDSAPHLISQALQQVAFSHVFSHSEVEMQELRGYQIIHGLLDYYKPLMKLEIDVFEGLLNRDAKACRQYARESRLMNKLPGKHLRAYRAGMDSANKTDANNLKLWDIYYRGRLMQDFISGMTDQFAYDEFRRLTVIN